jgi:peptide alpha-N-acetyltransferase
LVCNLKQASPTFILLLLSIADVAQDKLRDKLGVMHTKAQLLLQLGRPEAAESLFRKLLSLNPDDYRVHEGLHLCLGIQPPSNGQSWQQQQQAAAAAAAAAESGSSSSEAAPSSSSSSSSVWSPHSGKKRRLLQAYSEDEWAKLVALYDSLAQQYPKSMACQRIPLDFLVGEKMCMHLSGFELVWKLEGFVWQYLSSMACQRIPPDLLVGEIGVSGFAG